MKLLIVMVCSLLKLRKFNFYCIIAEETSFMKVSHIDLF